MLFGWLVVHLLIQRACIASQFLQLKISPQNKKTPIIFVAGNFLSVVIPFQN
jgi:hypothetical protein